MRAPEESKTQFVWLKSKSFTEGLKISKGAQICWKLWGIKERGMSVKVE